MKQDFRKSIHSYKAPKGKFEIISVPKLQYLMIDGAGDPNTSTAYKDAIEALYPLAYKLKFASKALGKDYVVMPLEALWWSDNMDTFTSKRDKSQWRWTAMIMQPEWISQEMLSQVQSNLTAIGTAPVAMNLARLERLDEQQSVQTLHIGSYDDEAPVLKEMHETFIPNNGLRMTKKHHEIYFSDVRKTEASKLRTILRQPVEKQ